MKFRDRKEISKKKPARNFENGKIHKSTKENIKNAPIIVHEINRSHAYVINFLNDHDT